MTNKRFEMYEYRQVLVRMRMGESNRAIAEAGLMGRKKAQKLRDLAQAYGWLEPLNSLPDNTQLATVLMLLFTRRHRRFHRLCPTQIKSING
jgi:predicted kinase